MSTLARDDLGGFRNYLQIDKTRFDVGARCRLIVSRPQYWKIMAGVQ